MKIDIKWGNCVFHQLLPNPQLLRPCMWYSLLDHWVGVYGSAGQSAAFSGVSRQLSGCARAVSVYWLVVLCLLYTSASHHHRSPVGGRLCCWGRLCSPGRGRRPPVEATIIWVARRRPSNDSEEWGAVCCGSWDWGRFLFPCVQFGSICGMRGKVRVWLRLSTGRRMVCPVVASRPSYA